MPEIEKLAGPTISIDPNNSVVTQVTVTITPQEEASAIYYKKENGSYEEYTQPFVVTKNEIITAYYIRKSDGKVSELSIYSVKNIGEASLPYVRIDANPEEYLKNVQDSVEVTISGENYNKLEYSTDGVMYKTYNEPFTLRKSSTVYAKGTNATGEKVEKLVIPTKTAPTFAEELNVYISSNPSQDGSGRLYNSAEVTIYYDTKAQNKYYKIGDGEWQEYTRPFTVYQNATIYAYCTSDNGRGEAKLNINNLTSGISEPIITVSPVSEQTNQVKVSIEYASNANNKKYKVGNGEYQNYAGEFYVFENTVIYAYNEDVLANRASSTKVISNITSGPVILDMGMYYLIKLNYPEQSLEETREYKWKESGTWRLYSTEGIALIKQEYKDEIERIGESGVRVTDNDGNEVVIKDHWYVLDCPVSKIKDNLLVRWDDGESTGSQPTIVLSTEDPAQEVTVGISYRKDIVEKLYKLVYEDGTDTGWMEYTGSFTINKNNTMVFAKGTTENNRTTKTSSKQIINIDSIEPTLEIIGDLTKTRKTVNLMVNATDDKDIYMIKYAKGKQDKDYFNEDKGNNGTTVKNNSIVKIIENGVYTFYCVDQAGHEVIKVVNVTNVNPNAVDLEINVLESSTRVEAMVEIVTGELTDIEYSIGGSGNYKPYNGVLTLSAYDMASLKNSDGSLTIYARGRDTDGNIIEISEVTYILDLDIPNKPVINTYELYPRITSDDISINTIQTITYDDRTDIVNEYSIDGENFLPYTGPMEVSNVTLIARSKKLDSGISVTTSKQIPLPTDMLGKNAYDKDMNTYETISSGRSEKFIIDNALEGESLRIYVGNQPANNAVIRIYDRDGNLIDTISVKYPTTVVKIPTGGYKFEIYSGSSSLQVKEVELRGARQEDTKAAPIITLNKATWSQNKTVTISYPVGTFAKEYSIDGGTTWDAYTTSFEVDENLTVFARTRQNDKILGTSSFTITTIDKEAPILKLQAPSVVAIGYDKEVPASVEYPISGGSTVCTAEGVDIENIANVSELPLGTHTIVCKATSGAGVVATASQQIKVKVMEDITDDSILKALDTEEIVSGKFNIYVADETYPVHSYVYYGNKTWTTSNVPHDGIFGDQADVASGTDASQMAQRMVVVKVYGDLTLKSGVTLQPYSTKYGGPKGFLVYVTGKLTIENGASIDNSHGAYAEGQDVYLWKNSITNNYEFVPKAGAAGAGKATGATGGAASTITISNRATAGGGAGAGWGTGGAGSAGTSYSGGSGGGGAYNDATAGSASPNGGAGGTQAGKAGSGAGNPAGAQPDTAKPLVPAKNATGGLLIIYADSYKNSGTIVANGSDGGLMNINSTNGAGSGAGSINIFTNQETEIDQLGIDKNAKYTVMLGTVTVNGGTGKNSASSTNSGNGGTGSINIGEIRNGQYYDLKDAIQQDIDTYTESVTRRKESILKIMEENFESGYYFFEVTGNNGTKTTTEKYPVHMYSYQGNQVWKTSNVPNSGIFGDVNDISRDVAATSTTSAYRSYAQNMVIVRVNGDLTLKSGVTLKPYSTKYGGPKGFLVYVTGKLTIESGASINNSKGAYAEGQDVYLWKNADGTYEFVPKVGGAGAGKATGGTGGAASTITTSKRATAGGGAGAGWGSGGAGAAGTSYSGGSGGGGAYNNATAGAASGNGGPGGSAAGGAGGGAGNPAGSGSNGLVAPQNGTGGLLIIYADSYKNSGTIVANGSDGGLMNINSTNGAGSGAGSINIFTNQETEIDQLGIDKNAKYTVMLGTVTVNGGTGKNSASSTNSGNGGTGSINIGEIRNGQYYDLKDAIQQDIDTYTESVTRRKESILKIMEENFESGYYFFEVTGNNGTKTTTEKYPVHMYSYQGNQVWKTSNVPNSGIFGDVNDISRDVAATSTTSAYRSYAQNMVIVRVNGDLTLKSGVTLQPYSTTYGGPKGFLVYVTGKLTIENGAKIDNSKGAYAEGQDVYLWKNADGTYEFIPKAGAAGGASVSRTATGGAGKAGSTAGKRATAGGAGGGSSNYGKVSGAGAAGTSYSGGAGGGGTYRNSNAGAGGPNGGAGGTNGDLGSKGAGNPSGGTGGLLIIYADSFKNSGTLTANGAAAASVNGCGGGGSGAGTINIFTNQDPEINQLGVDANTKYGSMLGTATTNGGAGGSGGESSGGAGGAGTINIGEIRNGQYYDLKDIIQQDIDKLKPTIESVYTYPTLTETGLEPGYYTVSMTAPSLFKSISYSLDNGSTWQTYTEPIVLSAAQTVKAKGITSANAESEITTLAITAVSDYLDSTATWYTSNRTRAFYIDSDFVGKNLRIYTTTSKPNVNANIKIYDEDANLIDTYSFSDKVTIIKLPENSKKIELYSGSSSLYLAGIDVRDDNQTIVSDVPVITTSSTEWTTSKFITIAYPDGYTNEYSVDNGITWETYTGDFEVTANKTVFARTVDGDGKMISSSSLTITMIDNAVPSIALDIPDEIGIGKTYNLPTSYTKNTDKSGATAECKIGEDVVTTTTNLPVGEYTIDCTVTTGTGVTNQISKTINVFEYNTITYDYQTDEVTNTTQEVFVGRSMGTLATAPRDEYTLVGWYTDTEFGTQVTTETVPEGNVTYYAKWERIPSVVLLNTIMSDNTVVETPPTLTKTAKSTDEVGFYKMTTTNGYGGTGTDTYYFRGAVTNNVVEFAGQTWRIVRVNEDGTIRLVLDTRIKNSSNSYNSKFNSTGSSYENLYYSNAENDIKKTLEDWYNNTITGDNLDKVVTGNYFCEAAKVKSTNSYTANNAALTLYSAYTPDLSCESYYCDNVNVTKADYEACTGSKTIKTTDGNGKGYVSASVGLLTYDEVVLAGSYYGYSNNTYYLYKTAANGNNNYSYWTMNAAGFYSSYARNWYVNTDGNFSVTTVPSTSAVRPVINIKADTNVIKSPKTGHYIVQ